MLTPRSDKLVAEINRVIGLYNDGAICSPEACIQLLVELGNWEPEIVAESIALQQESDRVWNERERLREIAELNKMLPPE